MISLDLILNDRNAHYYLKECMQDNFTLAVQLLMLIYVQSRAL